MYLYLVGNKDENEHFKLRSQREETIPKTRVAKGTKIS